MGHCRRSKNELISDVLLWTPSHGCASVGWPTRTYLQQPCMDTGCSLEEMPEAMDDREEWWERVREIHASSMMMMMMILKINILLWSKIGISNIQPNSISWSLQYTDCKNLPLPKKRKCLRYDTKLHLVVRLQFWRSREGSTPSLPLFQGPFWPRVVVPIRVPSMSEIDLFENYYN